MLEFCGRLKTLRKSQHLTQKQLAAMIGVQHSVISFYEVGDRIPSVEVLVKLASALHTSTDYLLGIEKKDIIDLTGLNAEDKSFVRAMVANLRQKKEYKK